MNNSTLTRRFRLAGVLLLVLGLGGAGLVWWLEPRPDDMYDEDAMLADNKVETRQMEVLYGKQALLFENWKEDLKQPGNQALLIAVTAGLLAAGCFYIARRAEYADGPDDEPR